MVLSWPVFFFSVGNNRNSNLLLHMKSCEGERKKKILKVHLIVLVLF